MDTNRWIRVAIAAAAVAWGANQFAPMLLVYHDELGISTAVAQATFGLYAVGLVPGLLLGGPFSDRHGRRPVLIGALLASCLAGSILALGGDSVGLIFAGRLVAGIASGAAFSSGAAWIKELSPADSGALRATVAMTVGFAVGPLVAGVLAQWAPARTVVPYLPQIALALVALPLVAALPHSGTSSARRARGGAFGDRRFRAVVAPLAPWVFGSAAIPLAYLPGLVGDRVGGGELVFGAAAAMLTALAGIAVQPLVRRVERPDSPRLLALALGIVTVGLLVAALAAAERSPDLVIVTSILLGAGYGACQLCGLLEVGRLAPAERLAGMTAAYQALSYTGFALPFLIASVAAVVAPALSLAILAALAALTAVVTVHAYRPRASRGRDAPGRVPQRSRTPGLERP